MQDKIVINDYIEKEPLSEENLDTTLDLVNEIRLSLPQKFIWLYTGYTWNDIWKPDCTYINGLKYFSYEQIKRQDILKQCTVMVDGRYIDSQQDITLPYRGSKNQRVINIKKSIEQNKIILHCN